MKLIFSLFIVNAVLDKCFAGGGANIIFKSSYLGNLIFYSILYICIFLRSSARKGKKSTAKRSSGKKSKRDSDSSSSEE